MKTAEKNKKKKAWYNNGTIQILTSDECPDGFKAGRLPVSDETRKKHRENNAWKTMTEEQKVARNTKLKNIAASRSKEEKDRISTNISTNRKGKGIGNTPWNKNKKGLQVAWNKGKHLSEEQKQKIITTKRNKSEEEKQAIAKKMSLARKGKPTWNKGLRYTIDEDKNKARKIKEYTTKKLNNTFNSSKPEEYAYEYLVNKYGKEDVERQYTDSRYPFACDFYIKSLDLFIELNVSWTHNDHLFNDQNPKDLEILDIWKQKAESSDYYKNAINTWTIRDVKKFNTAEINNLNYIIIYKISELKNII